jgi:hypothetical protein
LVNVLLSWPAVSDAGHAASGTLLGRQGPHFVAMTAERPSFGESSSQWLSYWVVVIVDHSHDV